MQNIINAYYSGRRRKSRPKFGSTNPVHFTRAHDRERFEKQQSAAAQAVVDRYAAKLLAAHKKESDS